MNPLEKKKLIKEQFNKNKKLKGKDNIISFKSLSKNFEPETLNLYNAINSGGVKHD